MGANVEVTHRNECRTNGWSLPLHPFQFIAWIFLVYFASFHFATIVPGLPNHWQPAAYISVGILLVLHIVIHLVCVSINPADVNVLYKFKQKRLKVPEFDRTQHRHVIENMHCYLCEVDVGPKSKHCSACNKCVSDFDHHCKWLNNCVGGRNYRLFLTTLGTGFVACLIPVVLCFMMFIAYFTDRNSGNILKPYRDALDLSANSHLNSGLAVTMQSAGNNASLVTVLGAEDPLVTMASTASGLTGLGVSTHKPVFRLYYGAVPDEAWLAVKAISGILGLVAVGLLVHLLGFHAYLVWKGLSTYDYIIQEREKAEAAARDRELETQNYDPPPPTSRCKPTKTNQVAPQSDEFELANDQTTTRSNEVAAHGGILAEHERAIKEATYVGDETPPPVPTPPEASSPPISPQEPEARQERAEKRPSERRRSRNRDPGGEQYEAGGQRGHHPPSAPKKKKKRARPPQASSSSGYSSSYRDADPVLLGNGLLRSAAGNGHLPSLEDISELTEAIHRARTPSPQSLSSSDDPSCVDIALSAVQGGATSKDTISEPDSDPDPSAHEHDPAVSRDTNKLVASVTKVKQHRKSQSAAAAAAATAAAKYNLASHGGSGAGSGGSGSGSLSCVVSRSELMSSDSGMGEGDHDDDEDVIVGGAIGGAAPECGAKSMAVEGAQEVAPCGRMCTEQGVPGLYTPRSYSSRLDVEGVPAPLRPLPPPPLPNVRPAAPAADYHSDSAESLQEIPVVQTRMGSVYSSRSPRRSDSALPGTGGGSGQPLSAREASRQTASGNDVSHSNKDTNGNVAIQGRGQLPHKLRRKRQKRANMRAEAEDSAACRPSTSVRTVSSMGELNGQRVTPALAINAQRHDRPRRSDVPPLDLTSLGRSDDDDNDVIMSTSTASKRTRQVSQI